MNERRIKPNRMIYGNNIQKPVENVQGYPYKWGYCPNCGETISQTSCPFGCKWCLQKLDWENENDINS